MTLIDALVAGVQEAPEDDAPRLVLADALQERGDIWGEIIPLSCRLASLDRNSTEAHDLSDRILALRRQRWPYPPFVGSIVRGFFDLVWTDDVGVAQVRGPEHALLRVLRVRKVTDAGLDALASTPVIAHVDQLQVEAAGPCSADRAVAALTNARCRALKLRDLELSGADLTAMFAGPLGHTLRCLAVGQRRSPVMAGASWPALEALTLSHELRDDDVVTLFGDRQLLGLRELDLLYNPLGDRAIETLAVTPFTQLGALKLEVTAPAGIAALSRSAHLQRLTALALRWGYDVEVDAKTLIQLARFARLTDLELDITTTVPALQAMYAGLESPLHRLHVTASGTVAAVLPPFERPAYAGLRELGLPFHPVGDHGAERIARAELPHLRSLDLASCGIGPAGAGALARSATLPRELHLKLYGNDLGPHGAALRARYAKVDHTG